MVSVGPRQTLYSATPRLTSVPSFLKLAAVRLPLHLGWYRAQGTGWGPGTEHSSPTSAPAYGTQGRELILSPRFCISKMVLIPLPPSEAAVRTSEAAHMSTGPGGAPLLRPHHCPQAHQQEHLSLQPEKLSSIFQDSVCLLLLGRLSDQAAQAPSPGSLPLPPPLSESLLSESRTGPSLCPVPARGEQGELSRLC